MNCYILTQEDAFYIPRLLDGFLRLRPADCPVVGAAILDGEIAKENVADYLRFLGPWGFVVNGFHFARYKALDLVDRAVTLPGHAWSVAGALRRWKIPVDRPESLDADTFHDHLRSLGVDLVISVACPKIVRRSLLELPSKGVINIHGALLPKYRGKLPSFWVLAHGEEVTGVTVHFMNEKLDDGPIVVQKVVPIDPADTLHSLILKSKVGYGAQALAEAVERIRDGGYELLPNDREQATYYSFPTPEAVAEFRRRGRKVR